MKKLIAYFILLHALPSFGQCTFERINQNYTIERDFGRSVTLYDKSIGFVSVLEVFQDTLFFPDGNRVLLIYQTDSCGNQIWDMEDDEVPAGADYTSVINNIVKDSVGNYYVISTDGNRFQSLVTQYRKTGKRIKQKYLNPSSLPIIYTKNIKPIPNSQNRFILFGTIQPNLLTMPKPLIIIMDTNLNVIKQKIYEFSEYSNIPNSESGEVLDLFLNKNEYYYASFYGNKLGASSGGIFLVKLDTNLNVLNSLPFAKDTVKEYGAYYTHFNKEKNEFSCYGQLEFTTEDRSIYAFWKADTNGNVTYLKKHDTKNDYPVFSMSPTNDGGFICGPGLLKLDSNFNVEWYKPTKGTISSITQLPDGGYVGSGVSNYLTTTWGDTNEVRYYQPYLIRTDSKGNYAPLSLKEQTKQLHDNNNCYFFPNPAKDEITIAGVPIGTIITVVDMLGKTLQTEIRETNTLSVASLPQGLYWLRFVTPDKKEATQKLVISR